MPHSIIIMQLSADIIAHYIGGTVDGDGSVTVTDFAKIEEGRKGALSFLGNPKYEPYIYTTASSIVLVPADFTPARPVTATLIRVADPYAAVATLMGIVAKALQPSPVGIEQPCHIADDVNVDSSCYIGAFAYVAPGVTLGKNVKIYPGAYIGHGVAIGDDTVIYAGVKIYYGCSIGARCIVHAGAVVGADGFGFVPDADGIYHKMEQLGNVVVEDDVEIGANTTIDRSTMGSTRIQRGAKLDNLVQVGHNVVVGNDTIMCAQVGVAGSTKIGSHCTLAGQVGVAGHIEVGDGTIVGAQSGIPNNVAPGSRLMGYPAVGAMEFARMVAAQKKLAGLLRRVDQLEKNLATTEK